METLINHAWGWNNFPWNCRHFHNFGAEVLQLWEEVRPGSGMAMHLGFRLQISYAVSENLFNLFIKLKLELVSPQVGGVSAANYGDGQAGSAEANAKKGSGKGWSGRCC